MKGQRPSISYDTLAGTYEKQTAKQRYNPSANKTPPFLPLFFEDF